MAKIKVGGSTVAQVDIERVLTDLKRVAATALNEEEFKINAERILYNEVISKLGLQPGRYEYTFISGGRLDALYGHVLIEYKAPGKLSRPSDIASAKEQLIGYIGKEAEVEERFRLFLGVILSDKIAFVRYDSKAEDWVMRGPYDLNRETVLRLIEALRGLRRKKLAVDELLRDFGPRSLITRKAVKVFYGKVTESKSSKVEALFNDWKRLFSQVCAYSPEKLKGLETEYGIGGQVDYNALLFSIHTYSALIMKLLGAEIAYLYGAGKWLKSYVTELEDAHMKGLDVLLRALEDLESGGVFRKLLNITNFIEGDYFSWYLEELDEELAEVIAEMAKKLADYEPATPVLEPEYTKDLLKRLYQNLVPKKIRHNLGEYYTPDWLAELVLNEVGLTVDNFEKLAQEKNDSFAPLNLRVLDPACGSLTFPVLAMKRFREYAEDHYIREGLADHLLRNVVGFDLNPLAVLAARTNYLLALADLFPYVKGSIEIPIYLADSLLIETRTTLTGTTYIIRTYVGEFQIPKSIVEKGLLGRLLETIDRYVRIRYRVDDFEQVVKGELKLDEVELQLTRNLYKTFLKLEEEGKNHVWASIIKNAFAPLTIISSHGKFDYVVGNPPWINWESLPKEYRDASKPLWLSYNLIPKGRGRGLGKVNKDIAMLFVASSVSRYLAEKGVLGFLVPFTTFKTQAGKGFRSFLTNRCKVFKIHDLVELTPFEGAINRTSMLHLSKGKTEFPIECETWTRTKPIDFEASLEEVEKVTATYDMVMEPIGGVNKTDSSWILLRRGASEAVYNVVGTSTYEAHVGVYAALNGVYWVDVLSKHPNGILIRNLPEMGRKKIEQIDTVVEPELVYPMLRGRDVKRWSTKPSTYIVVPHNPQNGQPLSMTKMKTKHPGTFSFLQSFEQQLKARAIQRLWGKGKPFYSMYDIGSYSFAPYKLVWKEIAGKIAGKGMFSAAVCGTEPDELLGTKRVIPDHKLMFVPFENESEAHYVAAVLNSSPARLVVAGYTIETAISTHVVKNVKVPNYKPNNPVHKQLSQLSKEAHRLVTEGKVEQLRKVEEEIDTQVAKLYGLTNEDLKEIKKSLAIFEGRGEEPLETPAEKE